MAAKKKKKVKKAPTPEQLLARAQRRHIRTFRTLFTSLGFERVATDGVEIEFQTRKGEIDDLFIYENIIVIIE